MSFVSDVSRSLHGAWRLFLRDPGGMNALDLSTEGFFRSFAVLPVAGVLFLGYLAMEWQLISEAEGIVLPSPSLYWTGSLISFVVDWLAMPLLMIPLSRVFALSARYVPYVVAYNWSTALISVLFAIPTILFGLGIVSTEGVAILLLLYLPVVLYYRWFTVKTALDTTGGLAAGLVVIEVLISLVISQVSDRLIGL